MAAITMEEAPRRAREMFDKGLAAMERGNVGYAIDMWTSVLALEPRLLQVRKFLRAAEIKQFSESKGGAVQHMMSNVTGLPLVLKAKGQIKKEPIEALQTVEKLLRKDPLNLQFVMLLGDAAEAADMPEIAIQTMSIAKEYIPGNIRLLERLGELLLATNQTHEAHLVYEELLRLKPEDPAYIKKYKDATAIDTMNRGGWTEAGSFRDVIKDTKEAELLEQQAKAVKSGKDIESLIEDARQKLQREPNNINYVRALADLLVRDGRFDEAITTLEESNKAAGGGDPQVDLLLSSIRAQKAEKEIAALRAAGDEAGAEAREKELKATRLSDARDRVARYPNDLQFKFDLGQMLFETGQYNDAIGQFQASQRNPQRRIMSLYYLARCFKAKEQYDIAREQLQAAVSELPGMDTLKKDILYELGTLSEAMNKPQEAVEFFKQIYAVDISFKDVADKIEQSYRGTA